MWIKKGLSAFACAALIAVSSSAHAADSAEVHQKKFEAALADAEIQAMTNPGKADSKIQSLYQIAKEAPDTRTQVMETAAAQWLKAEAIIRIGRAEEALPILSAAMQSISGYPKAKLHGDLIRSRAMLTWRRERSSWPCPTCRLPTTSIARPANPVVRPWR